MLEHLNIRTQRGELNKQTNKQPNNGQRTITKLKEATLFQIEKSNLESPANKEMFCNATFDRKQIIQLLLEYIQPLTYLKLQMTQQKQLQETCH